MSSNKQFRIQNGVDIHGGMTFDGQTVITDAGKATVPAVQDAVSEILATEVFGGTTEYTNDIIPAQDNVFSLGSETKMWKDVYIGPGSLYINGQKVIEDNSGTITIHSDPGQNLSLNTSGGGSIDLNSGAESVQMKSDLVMSAGKTITTVGGAATKFGGDVDVSGNTISNVATPVASADAATKSYVDTLNSAIHSGVKVFSDNVIVQGSLTVQGVTTTVNSETLTVADNIIDLNSNITTGTPTENAGIRVLRGDEPAVQMRWNEASNYWETFDGSSATKVALSTTDLAEGTNQYFTEARAKACVGADAGSCINYVESTGRFSLDVAEADGVLNPDSSKNADKLDGQHGTYYRINVYNVAGTLVN